LVVHGDDSLLLPWDVDIAGIGATDPIFGVLDRQTHQGGIRGGPMWPRRAWKLEGETCGTQFRQVRAAMCMTLYVMYVV
jgi:hypothetical protein